MGVITSRAPQPYSTILGTQPEAPKRRLWLASRAERKDRAPSCIRRRLGAVPFLFCFLCPWHVLPCRSVAAVAAFQRLIDLMESEIYATNTY